MKSKASVQKPDLLERQIPSQFSKNNLGGIFEELLKDIYWAEKYLVKTLPKMTKASHSEELRSAFDDHLEKTISHVEKLERCFDILNIPPVANKCEAMESLVKEGTELINDHKMSHARDAALIAAAQKIEHYEIAAYGTLTAMASVLGKMQCAELLEAIGEDESEADQALMTLAEDINHAATEMDSEIV